MTDDGLHLLRTRVPREWVDALGHMNARFHPGAFIDAADAMLAPFFTEAYLNSGRSLYTVEVHLRYLASAREGDELVIASRLLGHDEKRIHLFQQMRRSDDERVLAEAEQMLLHVALGEERVTPFAQPERAFLEAWRAAQSGLARPEGAGRAVGLGSKARREGAR